MLYWAEAISKGLSFWRQMTLAVIRRKHSPIALGRTSPLHLGRAINLDAESSLAISRGKSPLTIRESAVTSSSNNSFNC